MNEPQVNADGRSVRALRIDSEPSGMSLQGRLYYLDVLRVFAIFCVVMIHVCAWHFYQVDIASTRYFAMCLFDEFAHVAVPVFVMISGVLFLNPAKEVTYDRVFKKYLPRLGVAFVVWSVLYAFYLTAIATESIQSNGLLLTYVCNLIRGPLHFWFIPMIAGLYLITPLLRSFTSDANLRKAFLLLGLIFALALPSISDLLALSSEPHVVAFASAYNNLVGDFNFQFAVGYSFYFVLGYHLSTIKVHRPIAFLVVGVLALAAGTWLVFMQSGMEGKPNVTLMTNFRVFVFTGSVGLFAFAKETMQFWSPSAKVAGCVRWLSDRVFGVYLVHLFVIYAFEAVGLNAVSFNTFLAIPVATLAVFGVSLLLVAAIRAIPRVGKWLT